MQKMKKSLVQLAWNSFLHSTSKTQNPARGLVSGTWAVTLHYIYYVFCILCFFRLCQNPLLSNAPVVMTLPQAHFLLPMPVKKTPGSTNATLQTRAPLPLMFMSWMVSLILINFGGSLPLSLHSDIRNTNSIRHQLGHEHPDRILVTNLIFGPNTYLPQP